MPAKASVAIRDAFPASTFQFFVNDEGVFVKHLLPFEDTGVVPFLNFEFIFNFFFAFCWNLDFLHGATD